MKIFIDTANIEEIREAASWGILDGVTTNPSFETRVGLVVTPLPGVYSTE